MIPSVRFVPEKGTYIRHYSGVLIQHCRIGSSWEGESAEMLISVREIIPPNWVRYSFSVVKCGRLEVEIRKHSK
jgi:hypothetical protein